MCNQALWRRQANAGWPGRTVRGTCTVEVGRGVRCKVGASRVCDCAPMAFGNTANFAPLPGRFPADSPKISRNEVIPEKSIQKLARTYAILAM